MHPFDDPDVVAGQGSLGLELGEDVRDMAQVVDAGLLAAIVRLHQTQGAAGPCC